MMKDPLESNTALLQASLRKGGGKGEGGKGGWEGVGLGKARDSL
jgi:hypothetical protein